METTTFWYSIAVDWGCFGKAESCLIAGLEDEIVADDGEEKNWLGVDLEVFYT